MRKLHCTRWCSRSNCYNYCSFLITHNDNDECPDSIKHACIKHLTQNRNRRRARATKKAENLKINTFFIPKNQCGPSMTTVGADEISESFDKVNETFSSGCGGFTPPREPANPSVSQWTSTTEQGPVKFKNIQEYSPMESAFKMYLESELEIAKERLNYLIFINGKL